MPGLAFFNWSLKKAVDTEQDNFNKARIRIIYTLLMFSLLKAGIATIVGIANGQQQQTYRAIIAILLYGTFLKIVLSRPALVKLLSHAMVLMGLVFIWSNIFIYAHKINLITLQFIFMLVVGCFYTLGRTAGIAYSVAGILPVLIWMLFKDNTGIYLTGATQELASPGLEIVVVLNFISIVLAHYLFYEAFHSTIREKEQLNAKLHVAIAEAHKLASARANFLATMSHELRTPLNSVIGVTELLMHDRPEERQRENLKLLQFSSLDLLSLINNVLDFNKLDSGHLQLESVAFPLQGFMHNICAALRIKANDKALDFILETDKKLEGLHVSSDPTRLSQLIYNLASNAIKFTEKGSVTLKLECLYKDAQSVDVLFSVTDTGIGIPPDRHAAIFEMFAQAEPHTSRKYGGTGLGLAIVKQILHLFGSEIHLESTPGTGSRFFFTIPFTTIKEVEGMQLPEQKETTDISHLRILVAEDNEINRMILKKQLSTMNVHFDIVENGEQACDSHMAGTYHVIFMDLHMPVRDGYEATKAIRTLPDPAKAAIHIVAFTAAITENEKILEAGFSDYLYKPVKMNELREKLEKIALEKVGN